jgi:5-methylcytosine-specific restriction endonuclease McrA
MKRSRLHRRTPLRRGRPPTRQTALRRETPLRRSPVTPASPEQRAKVASRSCLVCKATTRIDPAHLVPRSLGGCDDALCVVALCRSCHRRYDTGGLDLVAHLEPEHRAEAAHAVRHLGLAGALRRIGGARG